MLVMDWFTAVKMRLLVSAAHLRESSNLEYFSGAFNICFAAYYPAMLYFGMNICIP